MKNVLFNIKKTLQQKRVRNLLIGLYVLLIIGLSASARASEMGIFPQPPKQTQSESNQELQSFIGEMVVTLDGRAFLMDGQTAYELRSEEELSQFNGYMVEVIGVEIKHKVGPAYQLQSVTPLQTADGGLSVGPVVIVSDVNLI